MPEDEDRSAIYNINSKSSFIKKQRGDLNKRKILTGAVIVLILISIYIVPSVWNYFNPPSLGDTIGIPTKNRETYINLRARELTSIFQEGFQALEDQKMLDSPSAIVPRQYNQDKSLYLDGKGCQSFPEDGIGDCDIYDSRLDQQLLKLRSCNRDNELVCSTSFRFGKKIDSIQYISSSLLTADACSVGISKLTISSFNIVTNQINKIGDYIYDGCGISEKTICDNNTFDEKKYSCNSQNLETRLLKCDLFYKDVEINNSEMYKDCFISAVEFNKFRLQLQKNLDFNEAKLKFLNIV